MSGVCCKCGEIINSWFHGQGMICSVCTEWGVTREEIFPTITDVFSEQFHRLGKDGARYWGERGAGILYTDGEKVLLLKRKSPSDHPGTWGIPGGRAKKGEVPIDTAQRETKEECGRLGEGQQFARFDNKNGAHRFHVFLYAADPFECTVSDEHSEARWVDIDEIKKLDLHPKLKESWPYYLKAIRRRFSKPESFSEWFQRRSVT